MFKRNSLFLACAALLALASTAGCGASDTSNPGGSTGGTSAGGGDNKGGSSSGGSATGGTTSTGGTTTGSGGSATGGNTSSGGNTSTGGAGGGGPGTATCNEVLDCVINCSFQDQACQGNCMSSGTPAAQQAAQTFINCVVDSNCGPDPDCIGQNCADQMAACDAALVSRN